MLSSFTLISLVGVMLGVLVLVVVMAVYAGLERDVKRRLLGFTPHVLLQSRMPPEMTDWEAAAQQAKSLRQVKAATPFISDNVIIDVGSWQRPVLFRGLDTSDRGEMRGIEEMLDREQHPLSNADLGLDDRVIISSLLAEQFDISVGDTVRLYSTRNFEQVMDAYKATENGPVREFLAEDWNHATAELSRAWQADGGDFTLSAAVYADVYQTIDRMRLSPIRSQEQELLEEILVALDSTEKDEERSLFLVPAETRAAIGQAVEALNATDAEKMDNEVFKNLKSVVLPKEAEVSGVYLASQMAITPDLFVPLHLAQDLAGLGQTYQGLALRLADADDAEAFAAGARQVFGEAWALQTWGDQYHAFFSLINQQRAMMYFALSFIVLVSAFSMMAVMFTVTIQKRREIGVMKALGAAPGQIVRVFLYQGMILGVVGAILGVVLGRVVIHFRGAIQAFLRTLGFDPFSASFTGFGVLPAHNNPLEQAAFAIMAFVLCSVAALVPAFFAARSDAAKSLRNL